MRTIPVFAVAALAALAAAVAPPAAAQELTWPQFRGYDVPYVPTPPEVVDEMLRLAGVRSGDILYDLGCGDGRIVIAAARKFGTRGVGIDLDPQRIEESRRAAKEAGVDGGLEFRLQDVMKADIRRATVVTLYLLPESNALLRPLLEEQLKPGTLVVSHNYSIPGWEDKEVNYVTLQDGTGQDHTIFVYKR
jgi:trans-aconitate methyltransferase